jgi:hypothetical protein
MKIRLTRSLFVVLFPVLLGAGCLLAVQQAKVPAAFSTKRIKANVPRSLQERGVRRVRPVAINLKLFDEATARTFMEKKRGKPDLTYATGMNFFPNVDLTVNWSRVERVQQPSGFVWTGTVAGSPAGQATMAVSGKNVTATLTRGDGLIYQIRTTPDGMWWVREVDQKELPQEREPVVPDRP